MIKKKVDNFKRKTPNVQDCIETYDQAISDHKKAIQDLEVEKQMLLNYDEELRREENLATEKANELQKKNAEIARLTIESDCFGSNFACSEAYLNILKDEFEI